MRLHPLFFVWLGKLQISVYRFANYKLQITNYKLQMKVSPLATYFNHFRRKYLNFEFVILNFELRTQCDKRQFAVQVGLFLWLLLENHARSGIIILVNFFLQKHRWRKL